LSAIVHRPQENANLDVYNDLVLEELEKTMHGITSAYVTYTGSNVVSMEQLAKMLVHMRLGHASDRVCKTLLSPGIGIALPDAIRNAALLPCEPCRIANIKHKSYNRRTGLRSDRQLQIVHSDVLGPIRTLSPEGYRFVIQFTDDFTRFTTVYGLRTKDEASVLERFQEYHNSICRRTGLNIAILQADGAYRSKGLMDYLDENHIRLQLCSPYSPGENGVAERGWLELANIARAMMVTARAPPSMWMFAFEHAAYIKNRLPTTALGGIPPVLN